MSEESQKAKEIVSNGCQAAPWIVIQLLLVVTLDGIECCDMPLMAASGKLHCSGDVLGERPERAVRNFVLSVDTRVADCGHSLRRALRSAVRTKQTSSDLL